MDNAKEKSKEFMLSFIFENYHQQRLNCSFVDFKKKRKHYSHTLFKIVNSWDASETD
jgi:hypothetical protein